MLTPFFNFSRNHSPGIFFTPDRLALLSPFFATPPLDKLEYLTYYWNMEHTCACCGEQDNLVMISRGYICMDCLDAREEYESSMFVDQMANANVKLSKKSNEE